MVDFAEVRMDKSFKTERNTVFESALALILLAVVVCVAGAKAAYGQNSESRPVARLVTEISIPESRPRQPKSEKALVNVTSIRTPSLEQANAIERRAFEQTNLERKKRGLAPLMWDASLCRMARTHSEDMARIGSFNHLSPDGSRLRERAQAVGIAHYTVLGENIAYNLGYDDPGGFAVERWMTSPKHRANILHAEFKSMAVGTFVAADGSVFLTQTFLAR